MKTENIIDILLNIEQGNSQFLSIDVLNLSPRVRHSLLRNGTKTISELVKNWEIIPGFRNMGDNGVLEITQKLNLWYQQEGALSRSSFSGQVLSHQEIKEQLPDKTFSDGFLVRDESLSSISVEELKLPKKTYNMLKRKGINNIGQIYDEWQSLGSRLYGGLVTLEIIQRAIVSLQNIGVGQNRSDEELLSTTSQLDLRNTQSHVLQYDESLPKVSIDKLDITERARSLLKKNNIHTVDQLTPVKLEEFRSQKVIGSLTIGQIKSAILLFLKQEKRQDAIYFEVKNDKEIIALPKEIGLTDYFNALFAILKPRYFSIIEFRYGLKTGDKVTLEETAKQFGVTRARIQQVESMAMEIIKQQLTRTGQSLLYTKISENIDARGGLISQTRLIDELQREFMDATYSMKGIMEFVNKIFDGEICLDQNDRKITYILTLSGWSTSSYDKDQILHAANKILEILSSAESPIPWAHLFSYLINEEGLLTIDENLASAIALCMSDTQKIQNRVDGWSEIEREARYSRIISAMRQHNIALAASTITQPVKNAAQTIVHNPSSHLSDWENRFLPQLLKVELIGEIPLSKVELDDISLHFSYLYNNRSEQTVLAIIDQYYPATFLVFMVGQGIHGYTGGDFWPSYEKALRQSINHTDFGKLFEKILHRYGKPQFHELLERSLRYVSLILAHGGIPVYCLKDFFSNIVLNCAIRPQLLALDGNELIEEILKHISYTVNTDKPVLHFMEYGGRTAANLLDRSRKMLLAWQQNQTLLSVDEAGLPAHLVEYFADWTHENAPVAFDRIPRNKLKRPQLSLDPWGLGIFLYLPSQPVSALSISDLYWKIEAGDYREEIKARTQRKGDQIETREITLRLNEVSEKILVQFSQGENDFDWKISCYSPDNLILAFDPETGQIQNHILARETWLMYPNHLSLSILEGDGNLSEVLPDLPGDWSKLKLECWDLTRTIRLGLIQNNTVFHEVSVRNQEQLSWPLFDGGKIIPTDLEENYPPVYAGAPPTLRIVLTHSEDLQVELTRWQIKVDSIGVADPEISFQVNFADLPETACAVIDNIAVINLGSSQFLNSRPTGTYQIAIKGPLGRDATLSLEIVPECEITGLKELYIPDRVLGPKNVSFSVHTSLLDGVDSLSGTDGIKIEADKSGLHHILVPAEISSVGLLIRRETINHQFIGVPIYFRINRLRWRLVGGNDLVENWAQKHYALSVQELIQEESPLLIVDLPGNNGRDLSLQINLLDMQGNIIQQLKPTDRSVKRFNRFWRFDLSKIKHSIEINDSSIFRVDLVGIKDSKEESEFSLPMLVLTREIQIMQLLTEVTSSSEQYNILMTWQEKKQLRSRALILWSLFRPWQPPIIENIPDAACGVYEFIVSKREYAEGRYIMQMIVVDPWDSSPPPSLPPASDLPIYYDVELSSPYEYLKELERAHVTANYQQTTQVSNQIEILLIRQYLGEIEESLNDLEVCCRNLLSATSLEILTLRSILDQTNSTSLEREFGGQIILPEVLNKLYDDMKTGEITSSNFLFILKLAPHSKNWSSQTCEILAQLEDPKIRFRALAQLAIKDIAKAIIWIISLVQQSNLSLEDAVELLYEEKTAAIEHLRKIKDVPIAEQLLELLGRYNAYSGLPVARVGSWVLTNAGWGRIDEILDPHTRISVDSFLEGDGKYVLSVALHIYESYDLTGEKALINMATNEITFPRASRIFVCQHCSEFATAKLEMFKSHMIASHGNALMYPGVRTHVVPLTSIQFNMNPQQNKREF